MPRKSNVSTVSAVVEESTPGAAPSTPVPVGESKGKEKESTKKTKATDNDELGIEDLTMPRTMVQRLAKGVLPPNTQIQKDAITALSKGATVFINYISSNAQEHAYQSNRKTINPNDVLSAMRDTEFEFMIPRLEAELAKWNDIQAGKRNDYRKKVKETAVARKSEGGEGDADPNEQLERETLGAANAGERSAKRMKGEGGAIVDGADDEDIEMQDDNQDVDEPEDEAEEEEDEEEEANDESADEAQDPDEDNLEEKPPHAPGNATDEESD